MQFFITFKFKLEQNWKRGVEKLIKPMVAIKCSFWKLLNLSWNKIGDRGVQELCKAMGNQMQFCAAFEYKLEPNKR